MDYFDYKDALAGCLVLTYFLYCVSVFVNRILLKCKSSPIVKITLTRNSLKDIFLIILTYTITIPVFTYYFGRVLRLVYCQFVDNGDLYLLRQGFFEDDYDFRNIFLIGWFYFFLIIKLIVSYTTCQTIRKDSFIIISIFIFIALLESFGTGNDIRTYSLFVLTGLFILTIYFVVRNKLNY
jgi:hypothetical protein